MKEKELKLVIRRQDERIKELEEEIERLKSRKGKITGYKIPFGYRSEDGVNLIEDDDQQKIIEQMRKMRENYTSYREISKKILQEYGVKISHTGIMKILNREKDFKTKLIF